MGSHLSCVSGRDGRRYPKDPPNLTRVLHPDSGCILDFDLADAEQAPVTAAELMLDFPSHAICHFCSLSIINPNPHSDFVIRVNQHRLVPLHADNELKPGELYVLLPISRLQYRLSSQEIHSFAQAFLRHDHLALRSAAAPLKSKASPHNKVASVTKSDATRNVEAEDMRPPETISGAIAIQRGSVGDHLQRQYSSSGLNAEDELGRPLHHSFVMSRSKSWIPKLEAIAEAPPFAYYIADMIVV